MNWETVTDHCSYLGEGPVWDTARGRLLWVDIEPGQVHQYTPATGEHRIFKADQMVGAVALRENGGVIAALQKGLAFLDLESGTQEWIADIAPGQANIRLNDAKCDPAGRLWAGTMDFGSAPGAGNLYLFTPERELTVKISGTTVSNGLAWGPYHGTFYFIDTPTQQVVAYDFDQSTGHLQNKRTVVCIPPEMGKPDGMTIDTEGMLWIALWNGWGVGRWNPLTGELLHHLKLPVARVTSCTFGGDGLKDLYITTAQIGASAQELEQQPLAGATFVVKDTGFKGMPACRFKG